MSIAVLKGLLLKFFNATFFSPVLLPTFQSAGRVGMDLVLENILICHRGETILVLNLYQRNLP